MAPVLGAEQGVGQHHRAPHMDLGGGGLQADQHARAAHRPPRSPYGQLAMDRPPTRYLTPDDRDFFAVYSG